MPASKAIGPKNGASYLVKARTRWKGKLPDWVEALAIAADRLAGEGSGLRALEFQTGITASSLSGVLGKTYPGKLGPLEAKVRGALMGATVMCPALGVVIDTAACATNQTRKFSTASPDAARFPRACKGCRNAIGGKNG
jgi:lambda repressor-like predicted transcriptional regulator